jgi:hypothetical protein
VLVMVPTLPWTWASMTKVTETPGRPGCDGDAAAPTCPVGAVLPGGVAASA